MSDQKGVFVPRLHVEHHSAPFENFHLLRLASKPSIPPPTSSHPPMIPSLLPFLFTSSHMIPSRPRRRPRARPRHRLPRQRLPRHRLTSACRLSSPSPHAPRPRLPPHLLLRRRRQFTRTTSSDLPSSNGSAV